MDKKSSEINKIEEFDNNSKKKRLAQNTFFLYIMTLSTYVLNLITIPYLTRVLGPTVYGNIGLAVGYMSYVQIILDFGFILSATQLISEKRNDYAYAEKVIASVNFIKILLSVCILIILFVLYNFGFFDAYVINLLIVYLVGYLLAALLPDYFYRGIENMRVISIRTVFIKMVFTALVFLFVKSPEDAIFVPISVLIGNAVALLITYYDLHAKYGMHMRIPVVDYSWRIFKTSLPFFVSRFASTFYQALDIIVLGKIYGSSPTVGYYSSADKVITLAKTGSSPIADSLYPYMLENKNYKLVKKMMLILMPIITVGVVILGIYADPICLFVFGSEYVGTGKILRLLLPIAWIILPSYIVAFPIMSPLGLVQYTNMSNVIGMFFQIFGLVILKVTGFLNVYTICGLTSMTEIIVFLYRVSVVFIHLSKNRGQING